MEIERKVRTAFVIMPSGNHGEYKGGREESEFIFSDIICPSLKDAYGNDVGIQREVDNKTSGAITRLIIRHLAEADVVVVDVTGLNSNVFLELGVRYALRRSATILLKQHDTTLPFDIGEYRCIDYSSQYKGPATARIEIAATLKTVLAQPSGNTDSPVFTTFPNLSVGIPGVIENRDDEAPGVMAWADFWRSYESIAQELEHVVRDGRFVPLAVLGISNGGLLFADLLGRHLLQGTPILSLWACRNNKDKNFFDNPLNLATLSGIESYASSKDDKSEVLLVDDIVASAETLRQAIKYLSDHLPGCKIYFLPLFTRNDNFLELVRDHIVWFAPFFKGTYNDDLVKQLHRAEWAKLPYKKQIRSA